jgi:CheY-like chemotaxis protein
MSNETPGRVSTTLAGQRTELTPEAWLHIVERLESADRLIAEVGHDFNNVLSVVMAYARSAGDLLAEHAAALEEEVGATLLDDLDRIGKAADRAAHLTRTLLEFVDRGESAPAPDATADEDAPRGGTETVLVAEDEEDLRTAVTETLRKAGYHVLSAPDGAQALAEAQLYRLPIDLLLTDAVMPGMLGRELAERLVPLRPGIRVLYMSGYAPAIMSAPGLYGLSKPFSAHDLLVSVRRILDANS